MRSAILAILLLVACEKREAAPKRDELSGKPEKESPPPRASAPAPSSSGVTIEMGPDGKTRVTGAPLTGDPKACAAFRACCDSGELGLACGLVQASESDCAKALAAVKQIAAEQKTPLPAGCR